MHTEVWDRAVSWSWLLSFVKKHQNELEKLSTQDVVTKIVIPETLANQCHYVDLIPSSCVARPTHFASHVWSAPFLHLVRSLKRFLQLEEEDPQSNQVFIWIDIFAVNQHRGHKSQQFDLQNLHVAIQKAQQTVVCMDVNSVLLTRIWCLFEIWHTFQNGVERLKIVLDDVEFEKLKDIIIQCDVSKAQATVQADRDLILQEIERTMPFQTMNQNIRKALEESAQLDAKSAESIIDTNPTKAANYFEIYGRVMTFTAQFEESLLYLKKTLSLREKVLGLDHPDTATTLNHIAVVLKAMGKYAEAEPFYRRALAIRESKFGEDNQYTATSINNLAVLLQDTGKFQEAEQLFRRALTIREKLLGPRHPDTATSLSTLGKVLTELGEFKEAAPLFRRALSIREEKFGPNHPKTATSLNTLASVYENAGNLHEAEELYRKALSIRENKLGPNHPNTATALATLAGVLKNMGKLTESQQLYQQALSIRETKLGTDHRDTAAAFHNLASVLEAMGKYAEAEPLYRKALTIREKLLGPDHGDTIASRKSLPS